MSEQEKGSSEPKQTQEVVKVDGQERSITRNELGQFVKGVSGNPQGRTKGSKNRTLLIKQAMEEALLRDSAEAFNDIVDQAITLAKGGDKDMIRFVLGDLLKEARRSEADEDDNKRIGDINITFSPFQGNAPKVEVAKNAAKDAIDAEFQEIESHTGVLARREDESP